MRKRNLQDTLDIEKKLRGYLFGSACGDALGLPVEHLNLEEIKKNTGKRGFSSLSQNLPGQMILS